MPRNFPEAGRVLVWRAIASMRPRQMPRNFAGERRGVRAVLHASMRPRQMPRNFAGSIPTPASRKCFNEAAADAAEFSIPRPGVDGRC